jgi:hypothetical protein
MEDIHQFPPYGYLGKQFTINTITLRKVSIVVWSGGVCCGQWIKNVPYLGDLCDSDQGECEFHPHISRSGIA